MQPARWSTTGVAVRDNAYLPELNARLPVDVIRAKAV